jgi:hypothetical protein
LHDKKEVATQLIQMLKEFRQLVFRVYNSNSRLYYIKAPHMNSITVENYIRILGRNEALLLVLTSKYTNNNLDNQKMMSITQAVTAFTVSTPPNISQPKVENLLGNQHV